MPPRSFRSLAHPGGAPAAAVFGAAVVRPLAACMLPLMVVTLVDVLRGGGAVAYVGVAYPLALVVATVVTGFLLRTRPAELHVTDDAAAVRTVWECLDDAPLRFGPVVDLRRHRDGFVVTLGHTTYEERDADWPEAAALVDALATARHAARFA